MKNEELGMKNHSSFPSIFDILQAKAKCKANLHVILHVYVCMIYICIYDVAKKEKAESIINRVCVAGPVRAKVKKGVWRMPRLSQAMKDVISCDKPRVGANGH